MTQETLQAIAAILAAWKNQTLAMEVYAQVVKDFKTTRRTKNV